MYCFRLKSGTADGLESDYAVAAAFRFLRFFGGEYAGFFRLDLDCRQGTLVALVGRRILHHADDVGVVQVFGVEDIDMPAAQTLILGVGILSVVGFAA